MKMLDDFALRRELRALRTDRPTGRDLWPDIASRLDERTANGSPGLLHWSNALVACAVLAVAAAVVFRAVRPDVADVPAQTGIVAADTSGVDSADTLLVAYSQILALENAGLPNDDSRWVAPGQVERVAAARELDASLVGLAKALRVEPESQLLRRLMHQTLQQRLALTLSMSTA